MTAPHTLVLGLGNPILRDDGVGWRVVAQVERVATIDGVEFDCAALGGLALMERLIGYRRALLVDSMQTDGGPPGQVRRLSVEDLPTMHSGSVHDASLKTALQLGRRLGAQLPEDILIIGIEAGEVLDFGETLSPPVEAAVPVAVDMILAALA
jgi:hydrogenase maturation protease